MITTFLKRKIAFFVIIIVILGIYILFNKNEPITTTYQPVNNDYIYLLDDDNYLVRTNQYVINDNELNNIKEKINYLIIDSKNNILINNNYQPTIPKNTKIIDIKIDNDIIKINFTKELLNVSSKSEEKMIESLIYTLTESNNINGIMIFVEGNILNKLPNSNKALPPLLTRDYGINKNYNLDNYKNTNHTTIYYIKDHNYLPVTFINNDSKEKIEVIIEELKSNSLNQTNLISYLKANAILEDYEILNDSINLSFNKYIFEDLNSQEILEEVKYAIYLSVRDNYHVKEVNYLYNNQVISQIKT